MKKELWKNYLNKNGKPMESEDLFNKIYLFTKKQKILSPIVLQWKFGISKLRAKKICDFLTTDESIKKSNKKFENNIAKVIETMLTDGYYSPRSISEDFGISLEQGFWYRVVAYQDKRLTEFLKKNETEKKYGDVAKTKEFYPKVREYALSNNQISIGLIQEKFALGYSRSSCLLEMLMDDKKVLEKCKVF